MELRIRRSFFSSLLFLTILLTGAISAQEDSLVFRPDVERVFVLAMKTFGEAQFDSAAALFVRCTKEYPYNHRTTGAYIMAGKSYYRLGNYRESVRLLKNFLDLYPASQYLPDAHYTLGLDYFRMLRYEDAASELSMAYETTADAVTRDRSIRLLNELATNYLSVAELQLLLGTATSDAVKAVLTLHLAERIFRTGDVKSAQDILEPIALLPPSTPYVDKAIDLLQRIQFSGTIKIGALLPLMLKSQQASMRELGVDLLDGMKMAVEEHNRINLPKVTLEVRDSERDPSVTARTVTELCNDDGVVAILGPVFSNEAFAGAGIASARGVPLLTPTATANGIASIGSYVFQLNPDFDVRGRAMARFAFSNGSRRFAVLSPVDQIPKSMAEAFVDEIGKLGGELIDIQWYQAGATDLRMQISTMRQRALDKTEPYVVNFASRLSFENLRSILMTGVDPHVVDSLVEWGASVPVKELWGEQGKYMADSLLIPTERAVIKYDSLALIVDNIDDIFLPIASPVEIGIVSSQLKYFNFRTRFLGTGEWFDLADLDQNRQYTDGVIFSNDTYVEESGKEYQLFVGRYQQIMNKKPNATALIGYDAAKLLLDQIAKGSSRRNELAVALTKIKGVKGQHTTFTIGSSRVNTSLTLLQFKNRSVRKIGEIDLPDEQPQEEIQP